MSDISPETIEAALKALMSIDREDRHGCGAYANDEELLADAWPVIDWAVARLAADRAERDERARPIDAEWCLANGARHWAPGDEYVFDCGVRWGVHHGECETARGGVYLESVHRASRIRSCVRLDSIKTRGQLGDLLRAVKGGA